MASSITGPGSDCRHAHSHETSCIPECTCSLDSQSHSFLMMIRLDLTIVNRKLALQVPHVRSVKPATDRSDHVSHDVQEFRG